MTMTITADDDYHDMELVRKIQTTMTMMNLLALPVLRPRRRREAAMLVLLHTLAVVADVVVAPMIGVTRSALIARGAAHDLAWFRVELKGSKICGSIDTSEVSDCEL